MTTMNKIEVFILVWAILMVGIAAINHWSHLRRKRQANEFAARCAPIIRCTCRFMGGFDAHCPTHGMASHGMYEDENVTLLSGSDFWIRNQEMGDGTHKVSLRKLPGRSPHGQLIKRRAGDFVPHYKLELFDTSIHHAFFVSNRSNCQRTVVIHFGQPFGYQFLANKARRTEAEASQALIWNR